MAKIKGTVKWFKPEKGYGFIAPDNGSGDVFVHVSDLKEAGYGALDKGERVEFDIVENRGREKAARISVIN